MFCAQKPRTCQKYPKYIQKQLQVHFLRFATICSAHRSPELVKRIPNAPRTYARAIFEICDVMLCAQKPRTYQKYPKCVQNKKKNNNACIFWDFRRYVLRTEAQNLSKVSQMHPTKNMQVHFFRFATLCSADRSPELVKSVPNASRKTSKCIFWDLRRYVLRTEAQNLPKVSQMHPDKLQVHFF